MPEKECIFCEGPLDGSPEHVWADWLRYAFPQPLRITMRIGTVGKTFREEEQDDMEEVIYTVCGSCNTGWMAQLEGRCAPFMKKMIDGWSIPLSGKKQKDLARWALKTAGTMDQRFPVRHVWPPDLHALKRGRLAKGLVVWTSMLGRRPWPFRFGHLFYRADHLTVPKWAERDIVPVGLKPYKATISLNHFVMHLVRVGERHLEAFTNAAKGQTVRLIYPTLEKPSTWPSARSLDLAGRDVLADTWTSDAIAPHDPPPPAPDPAHLDFPP